MGLGIIAGAIQGFGEAAEKSGAMLQKHFSDRDLVELKIDADRKLQVVLSEMRRGEFRDQQAAKVEYAPRMAQVETAALVERQDALRPGEMESTRQKADIDVRTAERKPRTLAPGSSEVVDGEIRITAPQKEMDPAQQSMYEAHASYYRAMASKASQLGVDKTALISNIEFLVKSGVASDPTEAYEKLRTGMSKPEDSQIQDLTKTLLRDTARYRGDEGRQSAVRDATGMVRSMRGGESDPATGALKSADDVRSAFKANKIDRATALRELKRFGYE